MNNEAYKTLLVRNKISIRLDDLAAMIKNGTLSYDVRQLSEEVMELEPGFVFQYKQANTLRARTDDVYGKYKSHAYGDVDVLNFIKDAKKIIKGEDVSEGGDIMSFLSKLINSKDNKKQQHYMELERLYNQVKEDIKTCENSMKRAISNAEGHSKESVAYRDSAREYKKYKEKLSLLNLNAERLRAELDEIDRLTTIAKSNDMIEKINDAAHKAAGSQAEKDRIIAAAQLHAERAADDIAMARESGSSVIKMADSFNSSVDLEDDEFDAMVARQEKLSSALATGSAVDDDIMDEFSMQVARASENTEQ